MAYKTSNKFLNLYKELRNKYGSPQGQWSLWCKRPKTQSEMEEVIIGAILTQNTGWKNVGKAMENLKKFYAKKRNSRNSSTFLKFVHNLALKNPEKCAELIKPARYFAQKTKYLKEVCKFFLENKNLLNRYASKSSEKIKISDFDLRKKILALHGVGPETADSIMLYALDKPVFVIDEYTRRMAMARKFIKLHKNDYKKIDNKVIKYDYLQKLFTKFVPKNFKLYQDFHALIVIDAQQKKV